MKKTLASIAEIKRYFAENSTPYYFVSATNFNMMGMHDWVRGWTNINLINCFDGRHPQVVCVGDDHSRTFETIEDVNQYLLGSEKIHTLLSGTQTGGNGKGKVIFLFFNEEIETSCRELNLEIILPKNKLVRKIDSKIVTTEIGNEAGVKSVPNVLAKVTSFKALQEIARKANLGDRWVVQTPYGDSGKTTFFISSEDDYRKVASKIECEKQVKVMRRINCTGTAIEACATSRGTFVGPLLTELIGIETLTPYPGGWCGNELYDSAFSANIRRQVQQYSRAMGDALYKHGYRGYFELDYLIDTDNREVYLGELNARISGISAMTNMSNFSANNLPIFLFHLLEYDSNVDLKLNVDEFNQSMLDDGASGISAQVILKYTEAPLKIITRAPVSGVYAMNEGGNLTLQSTGYNRRDALSANEAFILRIMETGEFAYQGGDLAIMFLNRVIRDQNGKLNQEGEKWVQALQSCFRLRNLTQEERSLVELAHNPANVKSGREQ